MRRYLLLVLLPFLAAACASPDTSSRAVPDRATADEFTPVEHDLPHEGVRYL